MNLVTSNKRVLNFKEACKYVSFSNSYMYKLTCANTIPFSKPNGKTIFFDRDKLDEWLLSNSNTGMDQREVKAATYISKKRIGKGRQ